MSYVLKCDNCGFVAQEGFDEEVALLHGWAIRDFGHACAKCSLVLDELDSFDDPRTTTAELAGALTKKE